MARSSRGSLELRSGGGAAGADLPGIDTEVRGQSFLPLHRQRNHGRRIVDAVDGITDDAMGEGGR
jgi:hypothetical protein